MKKDISNNNNKDLSENGVNINSSKKNEKQNDKFSLQVCKEENDISYNLIIKKNLNIKENNYIMEDFISKMDSSDNSNNKLIVFENKDKTNDEIFEEILNKINFNYNNINKDNNIFQKKNANLDKNVITNPAFSESKSWNNSRFYSKQSKYESQLKLPPIPPEIKRTKVNINVEINNLNDMLDLIKKYPIKFNVDYNINMLAIHNIKQPLEDLNNMIGMNNLKNSILDQILYFIQNFHLNKNNKSNDFMHTVIYGPPGTGKTETAKIIGKIFSKLGVLSKNKFKKATRADFIAGYLGQTALKTRDLVKECLGGVLFIDEAYALGNPEKRDSFAKECIDTLCEALSDNKNDLMVIIAGYEEELKNCFFAYNQGLDSRFTWRFKTDDYNSEELFLIFEKKVNEIEWTLSGKIRKYWFEDKMDYFKYFGRDMETLLAKVKICHSRRVFCLDKEKKKILTLKDMDKGFDMFISNDEVKNRKNMDFYNQMYV